MPINASSPEEIIGRFLSAFDHQNAVLTTIIATRGSTPQKAGAMMLVASDGTQLGTLGGGCVEAEVKRHALTGLATRTAKVLRFDLDHDYGWDDGLICGGRMSVLVQPATSVAATSYFARLHEIITAGEGAWEAVAVESPEAEIIPRAMYSADFRLIDQLGDSNFAPQVQAPHSRRKAFEHGGIAYSPLLPRFTLLIVGAGHVGQKVAELASQVEFEVKVVDDRADYCCPERLPTAKACLVGPIETILDQIRVDRRTYCLIVTRGHHHDEQALFRLIDRGAGFVGMIGSRRKIRLIFDDLRREGVAEALLEQVVAPVGLEIGSQTVSEIAISIVAQLIAMRNQSHVPESSPRPRNSAFSVDIPTEKIR